MIDLSPSFLCFECPRAWRPLSLLLALCPFSLSLGRRSPRPACRAAGALGGAGLSCRRAVRWGLSLAPHVGWRNGGAAGCLPVFLVSALSSVCGSLCVPRLDTQCGRRVACPAWLVPVNRRGRRDGGPLLAWMRRTGECVDYVERPFIG